MIIEYQKMYTISSDRIKEMIDKRGIPANQLWKYTFLTSVRQLRRNFAEGKMKGENLLAISRALNCTPYYFLEPSPLTFLEPLAFWHYEFQTTSISESFYKFFLARSLPPEQIKEISREDRDAFEKHAQEIINKYKKER